MAAIEHLDVLVIGAGLSGIGAGWHLQARLPELRYAILEARDALGGTWDLFRYPGVRSDSDMFTLGYPFRPWTQPAAIAAGADILAYLRDTAREHGIDRRIRYGHRVQRADWDSASARWTLTIERAGEAEPLQLSCAFLWSCAGYYRYDRGHAPAFPGLERFGGRVVHPQQWPTDLDVAGRRVVVIGSGATAMTLVPALARSAAHVTMLQRSPTWVLARPSRDAIADALRRVLPGRLGHALARWKQVLLGVLLFRLCRRAPARARRLLLGGVRAALGADPDTLRHFTPRYDPWRQRLCLLPDGDLFEALKAGRASVVTDTIESFVATGIRLTSGTELPADIVVSATGLELQMLGGVEARVDGVPVDWSRAFVYKGLMFDGVPNLAFVFGYTNASWTLRSELVCEHVCRLLAHMRRHGHARCTPRAPPALGERPWTDFSSGYFERARALLPRQGDRAPWRLSQNYPAELLALRFGRVDDAAMVFDGPLPAPV